MASAKVKSCRCIASINKLLRTRKAQLLGTIRLKGAGPAKVIIATETDGDAPRHKFQPIMLAANFCPFCGISYEGAKS